MALFFTRAFLRVCPLSMEVVTLQAVDIYAYKAKDANDAMKQHKAYALKLDIPGKVVDLLDKAKGISIADRNSACRPNCRIFNGICWRI